jgi:Ca2+-binding RTX toxin-like protein
MKNLNRPNGSRAARVAAVAIVVAAAIAATAGLAGRGYAAPPGKAYKAGYPHKEPRFKEPKLRHGLLTIKGTRAGDTIALRLKAGDPGILQVEVGDNGSADFSFARARVERIDVKGRAGDDLLRIDDSNGVFTDAIPTTLDGGSGNDRLAGGRGSEILLGGSGNDSIDGNGGNDLAFMGSGDDTFVWDPGDGSDTVEGQSGADTMRFNGAGAAEKVDLTANGNRLRFTRDVATITMDTHGVERVDFNALGGADVVTVNDLSGTDVSDVNVDLAGALGGASGDGAADRVVVNGTDGVDAIDVSGDAGEVKASGLAPTVAIFHSEAANDRLEVNTLAGNDTVNSAGLAAGAIQLFVDGTLVP